MLSLYGFETFIRETGNPDLPGNWRWMTIGPSGGFPDTRIVGGVAPLFVRGLRKGQPNWAQRDKTKDATFFFDIAKYHHWRRAKLKAAGLCLTCEGRGTVALTPCRQCSTKEVPK